MAQRCLYGVDKNPFAVNLAKLSLWLVTLSQDLPFTFVDHALKCGDSLVGYSVAEIRAAMRRSAAGAGRRSERASMSRCADRRESFADDSLRRCRLRPQETAPGAADQGQRGPAPGRGSDGGGVLCRSSKPGCGPTSSRCIWPCSAAPSHDDDLASGFSQEIRERLAARREGHHPLPLGSGVSGGVRRRARWV
jgi:hypothetical protein